MKKILAAVLVLFLLSPAFAVVSTAQLYTRMQSAYQSLNSFQAALKQSNHFPQLKKTISYTGRIYFTPGRMLMSFDQPSVQRLYIADGRVELYDAQSNTVFRAQMLPQFGRMNPLEILQLYWDKSKVSITKEDGTTVSVKLVPKKDDLISSLTATLNKKTGLVSSLSYTDKSGNAVTYSFSNIKVNAGIAKNVWSFSYPKGVQVVEQ